MRAERVNVNARPAARPANDARDPAAAAGGAARRRRSPKRFGARELPLTPALSPALWAPRKKHLRDANDPIFRSATGPGLETTWRPQPGAKR
jgi:hypothetical protein